MKHGVVRAVLVEAMVIAMMVGLGNVCGAVDSDYVFTTYRAYITYGAGEDMSQSIQYRAEAFVMAKKLLSQGYYVELYGPDRAKNLGDALGDMRRETGDTLVCFYYAGHSTLEGGFYDYDGSGSVYSDADANVIFGITQSNVGALAVILDRCYGDLILNSPGFQGNKGNSIWIASGAGGTGAIGNLTRGLYYARGSALTLGGISDWAYQADAFALHSDNWVSALAGFTSNLVPVIVNQFPATAPQPPPSSQPSQFRPRAAQPAGSRSWYRLFRLHSSQIYPDCLTSGL